MATSTYRTQILQAAVCLSISTTALAIPQWWNGNGNGPGSGTGTGTGSGSGTTNGNGNGNTNGGFGTDTDGNGLPSGFNNFLGFDVQQAMYLRMVHGILGALAFVVIFPLGSILMRIIPGRFAIIFHALAQIIALCVYIAAAGIGIYLVRTVRFPFQNGTLLTDPSVSFHPIIGLVVLGLVLVQPVLGYVHHVQFKKLGRRQIWSHLHLWNGRLTITLGIVNGGLGLMVSRASDEIKTVYIVVSVIMWVAWLLAAIFGECKRAISARRESRLRRKEARRQERASKISSRSSSS